MVIQAEAPNALSLRSQPVPPHGGSTNFSLNLWDRTAERAIKPTFFGNHSTDDVLRLEFLVGARMMGYELVDLDDEEALASLRSSTPRRYPIQPQQLLLVDHLNAGGYDEFVVEIMRRASKTTTIFCWLLGRCASRPDYLVTFSAQSGVKGTARLREWKTRLDKTCPDPESDVPPWRRGSTTTTKAVQRHATLFGDDELTVTGKPDTRGFKIMMGEVGKGIYFDNGSQFLVFKPDAEAYRGEAGDISWVDEAQELDAEEGAEFLAGIVPLQDTRGDDAAIVVSGTAGEVRSGPFWDRVNRLRNADPDIGGVDYCAPEDTPWEIVENEASAIALLLTLHPGIGTLTTEDKMRKNWRKLDKPKWAREYLSMWPEQFATAIIAIEKWEAAKLAKAPTRPTRVAFGLDIKPRGGVAAICAAWRSSTGIAYIEVIYHEPGTPWIPQKAQHLSKSYRGSTIAYDNYAEAVATVTEMERLAPRPRMRLQTYGETAAGSVQILREIERGNLRHLGQPALDGAVLVAGRREIRGDTGKWLWTPTEDGGDITALVAATRALRNWDQYYARSSSKTSAGVVTAE